MKKQRRGFSLIEIMIAMSICLLGLTILLQLMSMAQRYADRSVELAEEQVICQNLINEICSGSRGWESISSQMYEPNSAYEFSIQSELNETLGLRLVEVSVRRAETTTAVAQPSRRNQEKLDSEPRPGREFKLSRLIRAESSDVQTPEPIPVPSRPLEDFR